MYEKTRGIRNNNPGNIKISDINWKGEIPGFDKTFETFDTMENGIRAIVKILLTYQRQYKLKTLSQIIKRYSATDQEAYIQFVAKSIGVGPTEIIDVRDYIYPLTKAIIKMENGPAALFVSEADLKNGIEQGLL